MASRKGKIDPRAITCTFVQSYLDSVDWRELLGRRICGFLDKYCRELNSSLDIVIPLLLTNVAALLGPKTKIRISPTHDMGANLYMLVVALPGQGKTPAWVNVCQLPMKAVEALTGNQKKVHIDDCTLPGMMTFLQENDGYGYLSVDELCHYLEGLFRSNTEDMTILRSLLNKVFSGEGYSKDFATKRRVVFANSALSIFGTTHPAMYLEFLHRLQEVNDGLQDRFIAINARYTPPPSTDFDDYANAVDINWPTLLAERLYELFQGQTGQMVPPTIFTLNPAALNHYRLLMGIRQQQSRDSFRLLEEAIGRNHLAGTKASIDDIPVLDGRSKDFDIGAKVALSVHVLRHALNSYLDGTLRTASIPSVIDFSTLESALSLIVKLRQQEQCYLDMGENWRKLISTGVSSDYVTEHILGQSKVKTPFLHQLLLMPGKAVPAMFLHRRHRTHSVSEIVHEMTRLTNSQDTRSFGTYLEIRRPGGASHVFFKAPVNEIDEQKLNEAGISLNEYASAYNADMTNCPAAVTVAWPQYYDQIMLRSPYLGPAGPAHPPIPAAIIPAPTAPPPPQTRRGAKQAVTPVVPPKKKKPRGGRR